MAKFQSNEFLTLTVLYVALLLIFPVDSIVAQEAGPSDFDWLSSARIFILDAYTYPLYPKIEFDAEKLAETMVDMHADTLRVATSGHYYLIGERNSRRRPTSVTGISWPNVSPRASRAGSGSYRISEPGAPWLSRPLSPNGLIESIRKAISP